MTNNPVSLGGMQSAMSGHEQVSEEMLLASQMAVSEAFKNVPSDQGESVIYKLVDTNIRGRFELILVCDVKARPKKEEKTGKMMPGYGNERMRALTGVETIWVNEQKDIDKDYIKSNKRYAVFQKGVCLVPKWDVQQIEVLDRHNANLENSASAAMPSKTKFFKWNPEKQAQELRRLQNERIKAIIAANEVPELQMKKHAIYLGIKLTDELGQILPEGGLRVRYLAEAENNPKLFMDTLDSKEVQVTYMVKKAIADSKIDVGRGNNAIYWADGGLICKLPISRTANEYLVELALNENSEEGKIFLENLNQRNIL